MSPSTPGPRDPSLSSSSVDPGRSKASHQQYKAQVKRIADAVESISHGLAILDGVDFPKTLHGNSLIDFTARLNAQSNRIKDIAEPLKARIKAENLAINVGSNASEFVAKGEVYMAIINKIPKTVMMMDKVVAFLGKKLAQFQTQRTDITIRFEVKE